MVSSCAWSGELCMCLPGKCPQADGPLCLSSAVKAANCTAMTVLVAVAQLAV